jgi:hypothetical protein
VWKLTRVTSSTPYLVAGVATTMFLPMDPSPPYRMRAFRALFPDATENEYRAIEGSLDAYLQLSLRFLLEDIAAGNLNLTPSEGDASIK